MKKFLFLVVFAVFGAAIALLSALNEGGTVGGAWLGTAYAVVVAAFVALVENQAFEKPWKEIGIDVAVLIGGAVLSALAYTIF